MSRDGNEIEGLLETGSQDQSFSDISLSTPTTTVSDQFNASQPDLDVWENWSRNSGFAGVINFKNRFGSTARQHVQEEEKDRSQERKQRNRESAKKSRDRQKQDRLEQIQKNQQLMIEHEKLKEDIRKEKNLEIRYKTIITAIERDKSFVKGKHGPVRDTSDDKFNAGYDNYLSINEKAEAINSIKNDLMDNPFEKEITGDDNFSEYPTENWKINLMSDIEQNEFEIQLQPLSRGTEQSALKGQFSVGNKASNGTHMVCMEFPTQVIAEETVDPGILTGGGNFSSHTEFTSGQSRNPGKVELDLMMKDLISDLGIDSKSGPTPGKKRKINL